MDEKSFTEKNNAGKSKMRKVSTSVYVVPIFCGIFSFLHWFVLCPVLWSVLPSAGWPTFWFHLYIAVAFLVWVLVMLSCLVYWQWHRRRQFPCEIAQPEAVDCPKRREYMDTPRFPTKVLTVQPRESPGETGFYGANIGLGTRKDEMSLTTRGIPVQPHQNTPSLYGTSTGRVSDEDLSTSCSMESVVLNISRKQYKQEPVEETDTSARVICIETGPAAPRAVEEPEGAVSQTRSDDEASLEEDEASLEDDEGWCRPTWGSGKLVSEMLLVAERRGSEWEAEDGDFVELRSKERLFSKMDSRATIDRPSESLSPLHELPLLNDFDDYLHLVEVEPPLSPREVFFSDLIQQAQHNDREGGVVADVRKSYCAGDLRVTKPDYKRKSMPLFLYTDDYRQEMAQISSGKPETGQRRSVSFEKDADGDDKMVAEVKHNKRRTVSFEDQEERVKLEPRRDYPLENDDGRDDKVGIKERSIKRPSVSFEDEQNGLPSDGVEPMFLREVRKSRVSSSDTDKVASRTKRPGSTDEYFIAAVERTRSVTSEVHFKVEGENDGPARKWQIMVSDKEGEEAVGKFIVLSTKGVNPSSPDDNDSVFQ